MAAAPAVPAGTTLAPMARRGAPALYELMRRPGDAPATPVVPARSAGRGARGNAAPTVFEVPLGLALALALGVIVLVAVAYGVGVSRGKATAAASGLVPVTEVPTSAPPTPGTGAGSPAIPPATGKGAKSAPAADNNGDPRQKGYRYYVLAHPSSERAGSMVEFCRANGLDAYLVPDDNALLRKIIVLPGYKDASEKNSPEIKALEANIRRVGEKWKAAARGNKDFSDAFLEFYR